MRMIRTSIDFQLGELLATQAALGKHAPDGTLQKKNRTTLAHHPWSFHFFTTDEASETGVNFVIFLGAAEFDLIGIDDHNEVTGVDVRGEDRLVLATEQHGGFNSHGTEDLVLGVDDMPCALHILWLGGKCFHTDWKIAIGVMFCRCHRSGRCGGAKTRVLGSRCQCKISKFRGFFYFRIAK